MSVLSNLTYKAQKIIIYYYGLIHVPIKILYIFDEDGLKYNNSFLTFLTAFLQHVSIL